jgi:hypothetical protein
VSEITSSDAEISQDTTPPNVVVITAKPVKPSKKRKQKRKPRNEHNSEKVARARPDSSDAFTDVAPDDGKSHAMVVIEHHEGRATDKVYTVDMSVIPKNTEQLQINVKKPAYTCTLLFVRKARSVVLTFLVWLCREMEDYGCGYWRIIARLHCHYVSAVLRNYSVPTDPIAWRHDAQWGPSWLDSCQLRVELQF